MKVNDKVISLKKFSQENSFQYSIRNKKSSLATLDSTNNLLYTKRNSQRKIIYNLIQSQSKFKINQNSYNNTTTHLGTYNTNSYKSLIQNEEKANKTKKSIFKLSINNKNMKKYLTKTTNTLTDVYLNNQIDFKMPIIKYDSIYQTNHLKNKKVNSNTLTTFQSQNEILFDQTFSQIKVESQEKNRTNSIKKRNNITSFELKKPFCIKFILFDYVERLINIINYNNHNKNKNTYQNIRIINLLYNEIKNIIDNLKNDTNKKYNTIKNFGFNNKCPIMNINLIQKSNLFDNISRILHNNDTNVNNTIQLKENDDENHGIINNQIHKYFVNTIESIYNKDCLLDNDTTLSSDIPIHNKVEIINSVLVNIKDNINSTSNCNNNNLKEKNETHNLTQGFIGKI